MRLAPATLLLPLALIGGCSDTLLDLRDPAVSPTPTATPTNTPKPTPTPIPFGNGDGHDGAIAPVAFDTKITVCRKITTATGSSVTVSEPAGLVAGKYLILQVQDDAATISAAGPLQEADLGDAGLWELAQLAAPAGNTLAASFPLVRDYDSTGTRRAQACRLPEYTDVTLTAVGFSADDWDGDKGGVVGFFASGTLDISASGFIRVDDAGFRGGGLGPNGANNSVTTLDTDSDDGGGKGEGYDRRPFTLYGRANYGIGGGGGNSRDSGGGGGGGAGGGGRGGEGVFAAVTFGVGGAASDVPVADRLLFGGGGGAGHQSDSVGSPGGSGGGIVLLFVEQFSGTGVIRADGDNASLAGTAGVAADGAGGGGAGGTIAIFTSGATFSGTLDAEGGNGGDCEVVMGDHGPGGGGGGGRIHAPGVPAATRLVSGGASGTNLGSDANGATAGSSGAQQ